MRATKKKSTTGYDRALVVVVVGVRRQEAQVVELEPHLFAHLAPQGVVGALADVHEAADQRQPPLGRLLGSPDEQPLAVVAQDQRGDRDGRVEEIQEAAGLTPKRRGLGRSPGARDAATRAEPEDLPWGGAHSVTAGAERTRST